MEKEQLDTIELTDENIESLVHTIRGVKVMLDFDLARIYGYETKRFNEQVKNNIDKFPEDFMFRLTKEEATEVLWSKKLTSKDDNDFENTAEQSSWCQNVTLNNDNDIFEEEKTLNESEKVSWSKKSTLNKSGNSRGFNIKYLPYAFTEQGIYMLMTVLRGDLAVKQSIKLIRLFKRMKDYISESNNLIDASQMFALINTVHSNVRRISEAEEKLDIVMGYFLDPLKYKDFTILNGRKLDADLAYQEIYFSANHSVLVIDDYVGLKTLQLLKACREGVSITICSDNKAKNGLNENFIKDFIKETGLSLTIKKSNGVFHDRYIVIDYGTDDEVIYHCGASSKDAGAKVSTIRIVERPEIYHPLIEKIVA